MCGWAMFGRTDAPSVHHSYRDFVKPGVRFVQATVTAVDRRRGRVDHRPLQAELITARGPWRTAEDVELATLAWVHWFNHDRLS